MADIVNELLRMCALQDMLIAVPVTPVTPVTPESNVRSRLVEMYGEQDFGEIIYLSTDYKIIYVAITNAWKHVLKANKIFYVAFDNWYCGVEGHDEMFIMALAEYLLREKKD